MEGLFGSLASGLRRRELKTTDAGNLSWAALFGQQNSRAGVSVNVDSALKVSTVFACLRVLADGIAQVPLKVYREKADGSKELAKDHPAYRLLSRRPNEWMTSFEFRQVMMFHAVLLGNGCAYIGRIRGVPRELIPLVPGSYTIEQAKDYTLTYRLTGLNGQTTVLPREDVFHVRGPSWTGVAGLDALQVAREAVGLAIATEETHAALHANGTQPGGVLSVKGSLDDAARARLKESWAQYQGGLANRFKTAVLDMDSTWTPLGMKGVDAEHLDTRRFQIEEICRDLKVFPQMVGYADKTATFASAEAFFLAHVIHTLNPWIENWEQSLARDLFPDEDDIVAKFSMQGLLRGDNAARATFYASGITNGWLTRNEARRLEDLNPIEGLGEPLLPLNMSTQAERAAPLPPGGN
ncbi:phage portal protein [Reyranella sp.]|uniref:phage portal protein n=1 Tax=Reyranella sp. TaxID=1929291 RepID=UPI003C7D0B2E